MVPSPDLSLVDPDRRTEIARKIEVVENFLKEPGRRSAEAHAAELGIGVTQFYRLVRVWSERKAPEALAGAIRRRGGYRHPKGLDDAQLALVRGTEAGMADEPILERVLNRIYQHAATMGAAMPSRPTVRAALAAARRHRLQGLPAGAGLAIEHCVVDMRVPWKGTDTMPIATLLLDLEHRAVIGLALDPVGGTPTSTAAALLDGLKRIGETAASDAKAVALPISIDRDGDIGWPDLFARLDRHGLIRSGRDLKAMPRGTRTTDLLGKDLRDVRFRPRAIHTPPEERRGSGGVIDLRAAEEHVRSKLIVISDDAPLSRLSRSMRHALYDDLSTLIR